MTCKKCKGEMQRSGFERRLILRGKNKGTSTVKEYFTCNNCNKEKYSAK